MFESVGWGEILVLALVGLFVLGPERLPGAVRWVTSSLRTVREYATGAREQLRQELGGEEFEEFRKPLEELRAMRSMDPRRAIRQHLLDPPSDGSWSGAPTPAAPDPAVTAASTTGTTGATGTPGTTGTTAGTGPDMVKPRSAVPDRLAAGEAPPLDPDAT